MARVRDLWYDKDRRKTARHPDYGGNKSAQALVGSLGDRGRH
jgi:hypothetical protein